MIRLFGSKGCPECRDLISFMKKNKISYVYIDAMSDDPYEDAICEVYNVDELPHIQKLNEEGEVAKQGIGFEESIKIINNLLKEN